jgi:release factor glutamine methyltransferase
MADFTIHSALTAAGIALGAVSDSAGADARLLLMAVLDCSAAHLIAHPEQPLTPDQQARFDALVQQAAAGMPIPYLLGTRAFFRHEFAVTPDVLIPRPETEHLVEAALAWCVRRAPDGAGHTLVDVGTGSGIIALSLAAALPCAAVHATDVSPAALAVVRRNMAQVGVPQVRLHQGDLLDALPDSLTPDLITANLPYIPTADLAELKVTQHEPRLALDGGPDGLDLIRRLIDQVHDRLANDGCLLLEIGSGQGAAVQALCQAAFPAAAARVIRDYAGHERVVELIR